MAHIDLDLYIPDLAERDALKSFLRDLSLAGSCEVIEDGDGITISKPKERPKNRIFIFKGPPSGGKSTLTGQIMTALPGKAVRYPEKIDKPMVKAVITSDLAISEIYNDYSIIKLAITRSPVSCRELFQNTELVLPIANYIFVTNHDIPKLESIATVINFPHSFPQRIKEVRDQLATKLSQRLPPELAEIAASFRY